LTNTKRFFIIVRSLFNHERDEFKMAIRFKQTSVSKESDLEELICADPNCLEEGFKIVDRQVKTSYGPISILGIDSGNCLTIVELKVVPNEEMLMQALDYFAWVSENTDSLKRMYPSIPIDYAQSPRIILVSPSFSDSLRRRIGFIREDINIILLAYSVIDFKSERFVNMIEIPTLIVPTPPAQTKKLENFVAYIQNGASRELYKEARNKILQLAPSGIQENYAHKYIDFRYADNPIAVLIPRRNYFKLELSEGGNWISITVENKDELEKALQKIKTNLIRLSGEKRIQG
jgi:predicted transport protein